MSAASPHAGSLSSSFSASPTVTLPGMIDWSTSFSLESQPPSEGLLQGSRSFEVRVYVHPSIIIDWNELPEPVQPAWYESAKVQKIVGIILLALGLVFAGLTVFTVLTFDAMRITVIFVCGALALLALASVVIGVVMLCKSPSFNDSDYRKKLRLAAGGDLEKNNYSLDEIRKKYRKEIVGDKDINALIQKDVLNLSYQGFVDKHGYHVFEILNQTNKDYLRKSFFDHLEDEIQENNISWKQVRALPELANLSITAEEIAPYVMTNEIQRMKKLETNYDDFIRRNEFLGLMWVNKEGCEYLANKFQEHVLPLDIGILKLEIDFVEHLSYFKDLTGLYEEIIARDLLEVEAGRMTYLKFRERNGIKRIQGLSIKGRASMVLRLLDEMRAIATFEKLTETYSSEIFECRLLTNETPELCALVRDFIVRNSQQVFRRGVDEVSHDGALIVTHNLLALPIAVLIQESHTAYHRLQKSHEEVIANVNRQWQEKIDAAVQIKNDAIAEVSLKIDLPTLLKHVEDSENQIMISEKQKKHIEDQLMQHREHLFNLGKMAEEKTGNLERFTRRYNEIIDSYGTKWIQTMIANLQRKIQTIEQLALDDPDVQDLTENGMRLCLQLAAMKKEEYELLEASANQVELVSKLEAYQKKVQEYSDEVERAAEKLLKKTQQVQSQHHLPVFAQRLAVLESLEREMHDLEQNIEQANEELKKLEEASKEFQQAIEGLTKDFSRIEDGLIKNHEERELAQINVAEGRSRLSRATEEAKRAFSDANKQFERIREEEIEKEQANYQAAVEQLEKEFFLNLQN